MKTKVDQRARKQWDDLLYRRPFKMCEQRKWASSRQKNFKVPRATLFGLVKSYLPADQATKTKLGRKQLFRTTATASRAAVSMGAAPKLCTVHESRLELNGSTGIAAVA